MGESEDEMNRINQTTIRTEQEHDRMDEEMIRTDQEITRSGQEIQATIRTEQEQDGMDEEIIRSGQEITSMEEESAMSMQRRSRIEPELTRTEQTNRMGQERNDERHFIYIYDCTAAYGNSTVFPCCNVVIEQNYLEDNTLQMFLPSYSEQYELENIVMQNNPTCPERGVVEQRFDEDLFSTYVPANPEEQQSSYVSVEHSPTLFEGGIIEENFVSDDDIPIFVTASQNEEENNGILLLPVTGPEETEETYENNVES